MHLHRLFSVSDETGPKFTFLGISLTGKNKELNFEFLDRMRNVWQDRILTAIFVTFVNLLMFRHFSISKIEESTTNSEVTTPQVDLHRPLKELIIQKFES